MRRITVLALLLLCLVTCTACSLFKDDTAITFSEGGILTAETNTSKEGTLTVPAPASTRAQYCVGWYADTENGKLFLPVGATYEYGKGETLAFAPVYIQHLLTHSAAAIETEGTGGILFSTELNKYEWGVLQSITENVRPGTLLLPATSLEAIGGTLTHAAAANAGKATLDLTEAVWSAEASETKTFSSLYTDIPMYDRATAYTAVGYIHITYSDGSTAYVYASYGEEKAPTASLLSLVHAAQTDLSNVQNDAYPHPFGEKFSPYTEEERTTLAALGKIDIKLVVDTGVAGNKSLEAPYFAGFTQRIVRGKDATCADEWPIYRDLLGIYYTGALIVTAIDGTPLTADNIASVTLFNQKEIPITSHLFYKGALIIPYSVYTPNF